jgi:hypothetical protein
LIQTLFNPNEDFAIYLTSPLIQSWNKIDPNLIQTWIVSDSNLIQNWFKLNSINWFKLIQNWFKLIQIDSNWFKLIQNWFKCWFKCWFICWFKYWFKIDSILAILERIHLRSCFTIKVATLWFDRNFDVWQLYSKKNADLGPV